jgi:hypothetical protein
LRKYSWIVIMVIASVVLGCTTPSTPAPQRDFSTSDLLVGPDQLPEDWRIESGPSDEYFSSLGYRENLGGSSIQFYGPSISAEHIVAAFSNADDASRAYKDHNHTRDRTGQFPITWHEIPGWDDASPLADQFRIVCEEEEILRIWQDLCIIEAQYEEFLSIFIYRNDNPSRTISDLIIVAKAVDERMAEYLSK